MAYVYVWTNNANGKQYVGKGTGGRCYEHFNKPGRSGLLHRAAAKYGREVFSLEIVRDGLSDEAAFELEREEIARRRCVVPDGYNRTAGGDGLRSPSAETRARLSAAATGRVGTNLGRKFTAEHRARISAAHKGKSVSSEHLAKLQAGRPKEPWNKGKSIPRSPESVEKQRQSMLATMARKRAARAEN